MSTLKLLIELFLFAMTPGCPILTRYVILKHVKPFKDYDSAKKRKIHFLSFAGSFLFMLLLLLVALL